MDPVQTRAEEASQGTNLEAVAGRRVGWHVRALERVREGPVEGDVVGMTRPDG